MSARTHPQSVYAALKSAVRRLVNAFGNQDAAAMETRVRQQELSNYLNPQPDFAERHMPIDVVIDLEATIGRPIVTIELARLNGGVFVPLPVVAGQGALTAAIGETAKETGELLVGLGTALSDGHLDKSEASMARKELREAVEAALRLDVLLAQKEREE